MKITNDERTKYEEKSDLIYKDVKDILSKMDKLKKEIDNLSEEMAESSQMNAIYDRFTSGQTLIEAAKIRLEEFKEDLQDNDIRNAGFY